MKKVIFLLFLPMFSFAQAVNNHTGKVSMPSPDVVALGKFGETPIDFFTGVPRISVPIHTINAGSISLNIELSQHSSGLRPAETPSWVGHGWALNVGGFISRTVQGIEDEYADGYLSQGSQTKFDGTCFSNPTKDQPIYAMLNGQLDGEPDIFSYSVAGINGKFYLNSSGEVVKIPENDLKISYTLGPSLSDFMRLRQFVITNTDGTKYVFGESRTGYNAIELSRVNQSLFKTATSWKLVGIESADGKYSIDYTYTPELYSYANRDKNGMFGSGSGYSFNKIEMEGHRLINIISSTGRDFMTFVPTANIREDVFGLISSDQKTANALDHIEISNGAFCKKFHLAYQYTIDRTSASIGIDNENKKRLLLNSVQEKSCDNTIIVPAYTFEYDIKNNYLPHSLTAGTDHWGFYNGAENNTSYFFNIPLTKFEYYKNGEKIVVIEGGADKKAHSSFSKLGSLTKIIYPTSGYSSFEYEGNAVWDTIQNSALTYLPESASRSSCSNVIKDYSEFTITLTDVANTYFELTTNAENTGTYCCTQSTNSGMGRRVNYLIFQGNNQISYNTIYLTCGQTKILRGELPQGLQNGVAYTFRINPIYANATLKLLSKLSSTTEQNVEIGGVRIKKIIHHNGINSDNDMIKTYEYLDPIYIGRSSGILYNKPLYGFVKNFTTTCNPGIPSLNFTTHFIFDFSPIPLSTFDGQHVCYKSVKESTPGAGFKRYNYFFEPYMANNEFPFSPAPPSISTGNLESEISNTSAGQVYRLNFQKSDDLTYNNVAKSIFVKAYWGTNGGGGQTGLFRIYNIGTRPFRLASVENHKDGLTTITNLTYRTDKAHLLPIQTELVHPDGTVEKQTFQYAKELNQLELLSRSMIHIPLETQRFVNNELLEGQKITYNLFSAFPRPQSIQSYNNVLGNWETEATYHTYDTFGNPSSVTVRGWQPETYLWNKDLMIQKTYLDFQWKYEYEINSTLLKKYTEPNGLFTTFNYDRISRLSQVNQYNNKSVTTIGYVFNPGNNKVSISTDYLTGSDLQTEKIMDGLGRTIKIRKIGF
jgi:hypothetical protein